jgi:hypothetical protein
MDFTNVHHAVWMELKHRTDYAGRRRNERAVVAGIYQITITNGNNNELLHLFTLARPKPGRYLYVSHGVRLAAAYL